MCLLYQYVLHLYVTNIVLCIYLFLALLVFELRAVCLLSQARYCLSHAPGLLHLGYFLDGVSCFAKG
jgi:hypothetical protein